MHNASQQCLLAEPCLQHTDDKSEELVRLVKEPPLVICPLL